MTERITNERLGQALSHYLTACKYAGMKEEQLEGACIGNPYGMSYYAYRHIDDGKYMPKHDLPGFRGSTGNGYATKKEIYTMLHQSARALFEITELKQVN